jgi:exodeoxyribonuclease V alpha subunit
LLAALPRNARLVLLGDKDQLASVEAGSVLGQLCRRASAGHYDQATMTWLYRMTGETIAVELTDPEGTALDQHVVMLRKSHRFTADSGIGQLAAAVNAGDAAAIDAVWQHGYRDLERLRLDHLDQAPLRERLIGGVADNEQGYRHYLDVMNDEKPDLNASPAAFDEWARSVLAAHGRFQVLCALRTGPYGVEGLNQHITGILQHAGLILANSTWFAGRPVLVTQNDYRLGLMNGDMGITLPYPIQDKRAGQSNWGLRVAFADNGGGEGIHWLLPSRLLSVETVFALTVHKSQGSEFDHCVLILPPKPNPILTRELVYTGITRAKRCFTLVNVGHDDMIKRAAERRVMRSGGLFES